MAIRVTVWNEFRHEKSDPIVTNLYPDGMHKTIGRYLAKEANLEVKYATLDEFEHGLTEEVLNTTDVLIWWGHEAHREVQDEIVNRVYNRVLCGMGLIALHSSHDSKIFKKLMGTSCSLRWRCEGEKERVWVVEPTHPVANGLDEYFEIEQEEMYGERFDIPAPDTLVLIGWFKGGEVFRSGCCYARGYGKVFYFQPGHETYPVYYNENVMLVIKNAVHWCHTLKTRENLECKNCEPFEKLD